jgi:iron-sulfur cluster repair protein YtfE (RIC family)
MHHGPLLGAVTAAHGEVTARLAALEGATASERQERLAELSSAIHATADAEEQVLFPAARGALDDSVLVETCATEHSEVADRLETLASNPAGRGFSAAVARLAADVRNHMRDEDDAVVPLLEEALGAEGSAQLAAAFARALER